MNTELLIAKNYYAPKLKLEPNDYKLHAVFFGKCNFKCSFCNFYDKRETLRYKTYNKASLTAALLLCRLRGKYFKFTGGEPLLNPDVESCLAIVKRIKGVVYFDTNASVSERLIPLMEKGLIDVFAVSMKGLSPKECMSVTHQTRRLCWDNVFESISAASRLGIPTVITYVCHARTMYSDLCDFAGIIGNYSNVYFKINNYYTDDMAENKLGWEPMKTEELRAMMETFAEDHPEWRNRIIIIPDRMAVQDTKHILFM